MNNYSRGGVFALVVGHVAGVIDLVALPIWIGALVGWFKLDPQQAGMLASLFLIGQVISSSIVAPRFNRLKGKPLAVGGFLVAGLAFASVASAPGFYWMAVAHLVGGIGTGCALSVTHGTIGHSGNPHRLFALAQTGVSVSGILLLGGGAKLLNTEGGSALFALFAAMMTAAGLVALAAFPASQATAAHTAASRDRIPRQVWFGMLGMGLMTAGQSMIFSFIERVGMDRGYGAATVGSVLIAVGIFNLLPGPLAAWTQHRLRAEHVVVACPLLYAVAVFSMTHLPHFALFAAVTPILVALTVFTHIFLFGALSRLDASARAVAAGPAMLMLGSAIGPVVGGTVVTHFGYAALGTTVVGFMLVSALMFMGLRAARSAAAAAPAKKPA